MSDIHQLQPSTKLKKGPLASDESSFCHQRGHWKYHFTKKGHLPTTSSQQCQTQSRALPLSTFRTLSVPMHLFRFLILTWLPWGLRLVNFCICCVPPNPPHLLQLFPLFIQVCLGLLQVSLRLSGFLTLVPLIIRLFISLYFRIELLLPFLLPLMSLMGLVC